MNISLNLKQVQNHLRIGMLGAVLTLIGDMMIGYVQFPENAGLLDGYFAAALTLPEWSPILGGWIGFLGISLEFLGLMMVYPLLKRAIPLLSVLPALQRSKTRLGQNDCLFERVTDHDAA